MISISLLTFLKCSCRWYDLPTEAFNIFNFIVLTSLCDHSKTYIISESGSIFKEDVKQISSQHAVSFLLPWLVILS